MKIKQISNLINFVANNKTTCYRAFKENITHKGFKTEAGKQLIKNAREQLNYSTKTWDGDIYVTIWRYYKAIVLDGIELQKH